MKKIAVYGAGGFGREVKMLIDHINEKNMQWEFIGYFDDGLPKGTINGDNKILGNIHDLNAISTPLSIVIAAGQPSIKKHIYHSINNSNISYPVLVHPSVITGEDLLLTAGEGSIIAAGCILTVNYTIGKHVLLNLGCTVGHDAEIHDFCSLMPSVNVSGEVVIENSVYIGTGAKIINRLRIGANTTIGAGAVVVKNLPPGCTAVGIAAMPLNKKNV